MNFLKTLEHLLVGVVVSYLVAHKAVIVAEVEALAAAAPGSPAEANVNAAIDKIVPALIRPLVDAELASQEANLVAAAAAGAPALVDAVIAALQKVQHAV